ncbi:MAG: VOC family protein, partial [Fimbriimonas sp.]|nr:VOC family protein [Fimbriimonas sp.]
IQFDYIGIVVADMAESLRFYRLLGIEIPESDPAEPHIEVTLPNGLRFAWDALSMVQEIDPDWVPPTGQRMGLGFVCDTPAGVDDVYAKVVEAGSSGRREPWDAFWGQRYAIVLDPDGNEVSLFAWLEGTQQ